jgi:Flp pilus assembly pilin Flp
MLCVINTFRRNESGATATQYATLIVFVALAIAAGPQTLGAELLTCLIALEPPSREGPCLPSEVKAVPILKVVMQVIFNHKCSRINCFYSCIFEGYW